MISSTLSTTALLLLSVTTACTDDGGSPPSVVSNTPANGATGVALNGSVSATFSEAMDAESLTASTFTLTSGAAEIPGTLIYANSKAVFWPTAHFASGGSFTATISTAATSASGIALAKEHSWSFGTGTTLEPGSPVDLGTAGNFVILAKAAIATMPTSIVTGDVGISPAAASYITGFSLSASATNVFATSAQVTGKVYAANYASPSPANMTTAVHDMELAFTDAAGRAPDVTELGAGNVGGMTLIPGVYKWGTGLLIPTSVTLAGSATDTWIFQIAQDLTVMSSAKILLSGGAQAKNVFWQVAGKVEIGTTAHLEGIVLSKTSATLRTGASINGRLMAQTAVNIDSSTVVAPTP